MISRNFDARAISTLAGMLRPACVAAIALPVLPDGCHGIFSLAPLVGRITTFTQSRLRHEHVKKL
jgi:hypothetical protein